MKRSSRKLIKAALIAVSVYAVVHFVEIEETKNDVYASVNVGQKQIRQFEEEWNENNSDYIQYNKIMSETKTLRNPNKEVGVLVFDIQKDIKNEKKLMEELSKIRKTIKKDTSVYKIELNKQKKWKYQLTYHSETTSFQTCNEIQTKYCDDVKKYLGELTVKDYLRAAEKKDRYYIQTYLDRNGYVDARLKNGKTALMTASEKGHKSIVLLLLEYGANIELEDEEGRTALRYARNKEHHELEKYLK